MRGVWDDEEEARVIGDDIEALQKRRASALNEIAILVRASFQMRAFEDRFITLGLPYRVIGGPRFYERQEIKDAIAYLEITANPGQRPEIRAHRQCAQARARRHRRCKRLHELARARGDARCTRRAQMIVETEELPGKARKSLADLIAQLRALARPGRATCRTPSLPS